MYHLCTTATFPAIHHKRKILDIRLNIKEDVYKRQLYRCGVLYLFIYIRAYQSLCIDKL